MKPVLAELLFLVARFEGLCYCDACYANNTIFGVQSLYVYAILKDGYKIRYTWRRCCNSSLPAIRASFSLLSATETNRDRPVYSYDAALLAAAAARAKFLMLLRHRMRVTGTGLLGSLPVDICVVVIGFLNSMLV